MTYAKWEKTKTKMSLIVYDDKDRRMGSIAHIKKMVIGYRLSPGDKYPMVNGGPVTYMSLSSAKSYAENWYKIFDHKGYILRN